MRISPEERNGVVVYNNDITELAAQNPCFMGFGVIMVLCLVDFDECIKVGKGTRISPAARIEVVACNNDNTELVARL